MPEFGPRSGDNEVAVLGSGFCHGLSVMFGDAKASDVEYWGDTTLVCRVPALEDGRHSAQVPVLFEHQHPKEAADLRAVKELMPGRLVTYFYHEDEVVGSGVSPTANVGVGAGIAAGIGANTTGMTNTSPNTTTKAPTVANSGATLNPSRVANAQNARPGMAPRVVSGGVLLSGSANGLGQGHGHGHAGHASLDVTQRSFSQQNLARMYPGMDFGAGNLMMSDTSGTGGT